MVVFGGFNGTFLNDVHELALPADGAPRWRRVQTTGSAPCGRDGHSAVLAADGRTMLVFGGFDGKRQLDDLHALDTTTFEWTELLPASSAPSDDGVSPDGSAGTGSEAGDDAEDDDAEERPTRPAPRYLHSAVGYEGGFYVFGGYLEGGKFADDLWRLTLDPEGGSAPTWSRIEATGQCPPGGMGQAAASDGDGNLWISGGIGEGSFTNGLYVFEVARERWSRVDARGARPSPRHKHTLVGTSEGELLLFGGNDFGPTRGFYTFDAPTALSVISRRSSGGLDLTASLQLAPLAQLAALVVLAISVRLLEAGVISPGACGAAIGAALTMLATAEVFTPPPGGLLLRLVGMPRRGPNQKAPARFTRTAVGAATDLAAAVAFASLASAASAGSRPKLPQK